MNVEQFQNLLSHPYSLNAYEREQLEYFLHENPYFQVGQILYAQNYWGEEEYERILMKSGIHIPNPHHYYRNLMLNKMYVQQRKEIEQEATETEEISIQQKKIVVKKEEETPIQEASKEEKLHYAPSFYQIKETVKEERDFQQENHNFTDWLNTLSQPEKVTAKPSDTKETISYFTEKEKQTEQNKSSENHNSDHLMSQTLAEIYVKQRLYDRAIAIYEKLDLKSSEKNTTFARRIEQIKELKKN